MISVDKPHLDPVADSLHQHNNNSTQKQQQQAAQKSTMGKPKRPNEFKYGMALYGVAWPEGPYYFVCGGGGMGLQNRCGFELHIAAASSRASRTASRTVSCRRLTPGLLLAGLSGRSTHMAPAQTKLGSTSWERALATAR